MTKLFLAPMEGLGDRTFRVAINMIGGFDEACTEFIRVPKNAHIRSLAKVYDSQELVTIPLAAQIMGDHEQLMAEMANELISRGAPRIDLNCGCPSNVVVGRGAGSSLLKCPEQLFRLVSAISQVGIEHSIPVTVKMRSGYEDTSLFEENLKAIEDGGATFITIHPRTKLEGYRPPADWSLIARAKEVVSLPVIGNGDIRNGEDAIRMLKETGCDGLMIGRGAAVDPWIFHRIRQRLGYAYLDPTWDVTEAYLRCFAGRMHHLRERVQINKLKQLVNHLFDQYPERRKALLRGGAVSATTYLEAIIVDLRSCTPEKGGAMQNELQGSSSNHQEKTYRS
ncbi:tRNA-dihydrouridine(16) synthase [Chlamydiales bacterium SCGC AG-110-P3]|nr:tRNA-dihydrouridine(16) synthase [Chlamydiales bacterium SCGC AG-110-P3]